MRLDTFTLNFNISTFSGTRVVGAIRGPGIPKGGKETFEKHHATDWLPTLVSMAAGEVRWKGLNGWE